MRAPSLAVHDHPGALTEVDLSFLPRLRLHAPEGQRGALLEPADKTLNRIIARAELMFGDQVLVDPLGGQSQGQLHQDGGTEELAIAASPGGRNGWFWMATILCGLGTENVGTCVWSVGPGGRNGWF